MEETEYDDQKKNFEERDEDVRLWVGEQDKRDEGADAAVHDCRTDVEKRHSDAILTRSVSFDEKPMCDVSAVVDAKADGDDQVDAGDGVDGQSPEMHKSGNVDER